MSHNCDEGSFDSGMKHHHCRHLRPRPHRHHRHQRRRWSTRRRDDSISGRYLAESKTLCLFASAFPRLGTRTKTASWSQNGTITRPNTSSTLPLLAGTVVRWLLIETSSSRRNRHYVEYLQYALFLPSLLSLSLTPMLMLMHTHASSIALQSVLVLLHANLATNRNATILVEIMRID